MLRLDFLWKDFCFLQLIFGAILQAYNGDDYNGTRIVSRAYELRDAVFCVLLILIVAKTQIN